MKTNLSQFAVSSLLLLAAIPSPAGTLSYYPIPAAQSDANGGIGRPNQYTTAIDGGNASGQNRVINGIVLTPLAGSGQSVTADNCVVNVLSGALSSADLPPESVPADGTSKEVMSDAVLNTGAADNSQQEIVLDPASLTPGTTYDLRVYVGTSGGKDRQVNLSFVGDGQNAVETGFFDEDDARTSPGKFSDPNQAYMINYRFTWDGESAPGITVTQKSGENSFVLYALTNQVVQAAANAAVTEAAPPAQAGGGEALQAGATGGLTTGQVTAESDQVGVTSDTFYNDESLSKNGRWIGVGTYGKCWQPTGCPKDWRPYTRGTFRHSEEGGWTWVSDASEEEWGWAVFHYGRWARVDGVGCGWAWVPGTVWSGAWVSWRNGQTPDCTCVGWAPLPPETPCQVNVGISRWVDKTADIGPDNYTFVHVRDFGSDNYERCGCVLERRRYVNILEHTVNITNISYGHGRRINVYCGGPDLTWCNNEIRRGGGREIVGIQVNLFSDPGRRGQGGGKHLEGNTLTLFSPRIVVATNSKSSPKVTMNVPDKKVDHGWKNIKDPKARNDLKSKIADQTKGLTPETTKATPPNDLKVSWDRYNKDGLTGTAVKTSTTTQAQTQGANMTDAEYQKLIGDASKANDAKQAAQNAGNTAGGNGATGMTAAKDPVLTDAQKAMIGGNAGTAGGTTGATKTLSRGGHKEVPLWTGADTIKGDGTDTLPTDPASRQSLETEAAARSVSVQTLFNTYKSHAEATRLQTQADNDPTNEQLKTAAAAAAKQRDAAVQTFSAEQNKNVANFKAEWGGTTGAGAGTTQGTLATNPTLVGTQANQTNKTGTTGATGTASDTNVVNKWLPLRPLMDEAAAAKAASDKADADFTAKATALADAQAKANADPGNAKLKAGVDAAAQDYQNAFAAKFAATQKSADALAKANAAIGSTGAAGTTGATSKSQGNTAIGRKVADQAATGGGQSLRPGAKFKNSSRFRNNQATLQGGDNQGGGFDQHPGGQGKNKGLKGVKTAGGDAPPPPDAPPPITKVIRQQDGASGTTQTTTGSASGQKTTSTSTDAPVGGTTKTTIGQSTKSSGKTKGGSSDSGKLGTAVSTDSSQGSMKRSGGGKSSKRQKTSSDSSSNGQTQSQGSGGGGGTKQSKQKSQSNANAQGGGGGHREKKTQAADGQAPKGQGKGKGKNKPVETAPLANPMNLSDLRAKKNISFVGWSPTGIPIYRFSYLTEPNKRYQGTIAQAIIHLRPDAVASQDGLMFVDYSQLDVRMEEMPPSGEEIGTPIP